MSMIDISRTKSLGICYFCVTVITNYLLYSSLERYI